MLLQIREYLRQEQTASNQQIARQFGMDMQALQPLLDLWVQRGVFIPHEHPNNINNIHCNGGCASKCKPQSVTYYQYNK